MIKQGCKVSRLCCVWKESDENMVKEVSLTGPVRASVLACLEPLTAACLSAVWLNSVFTPAELIGFVCILATVLIMK